MFLTQCAACAADLGLTLGKKCGRCSTRYCGAECQVQHWKEGGHDQLCKKIKKAGGAEQYNANTKYAEAVGAAVEACADDTKGQTCYICTEAAHRRTGESLVRGCACHTTEGYVHVSCLAEQAKILREEAEENNLGLKTRNARFRRWDTCSLCEQDYHGVVQCALGWACWKTYVGRPETDPARQMAMTVLGNGLSAAKHHEDALSVKEADLSMERRLGSSEESVLVTQSNLAATYKQLGRIEESLRLLGDVYSRRLKLFGEEHKDTLRAAYNYANTLTDLRRHEEARSLLRGTVPVARRVFGEGHRLTLKMRWTYGQAIYKDPAATLDDLREAVTTLEDTDRIARRVLGGAHPHTAGLQNSLQSSRAALRAREGDDVNSVCGAVAAMTPGDA